MQVTALVPTHHLPEESMAWITEARNVFDEVIVSIDQKRVTPGTVTRAERVATRVARNNNDLWRDPDRFSLLARCNGDWIFILEYDEQLTPEWQQAGWRRILETTNFTHFWLPRRWTVPSGRYITSEPWWPDFQLRLFRNNLEGTAFPRNLHDIIQVPGLGAYFQNLAIHHHALTLLSRAMREEKVRYYERLRPGRGLGHYYLYEDYSPPVAPLPAPVELDILHEVGQMEQLAPDDFLKIALDVSGRYRNARRSELFWLDAKVINGTDQALAAFPPFPVRLAYHWIDKATGEMVVFDGQRSGLFPPVPANSSRTYGMFIAAPDQPGKYVLQTTMVQDGVRWLDEINPKILQEFDWTVVAE